LNREENSFPKTSACGIKFQKIIVLEKKLKIPKNIFFKSSFSVGKQTKCMPQITFVER
jgi:hypothetical protein